MFYDDNLIILSIVASDLWDNQNNIIEEIIIGDVSEFEYLNKLIHGNWFRSERIKVIFTFSFGKQIKAILCRYLILNRNFILIDFNIHNL